ncbi:putative MFS family arabinose efflux permease [Natrinema hispanicum]|uniref:Putative MFS family arabinose efflux permease n=1 Tax=Natrinema hispanicum TaxID=392421 RepID=A0A482YDK3_9EURY|nr:MFS transporter [Natrinema hispanicum]RZV11608.1 putative MFS family arabinose efflux permease [Natrinema hispanicum]
MDRSDWQTVGLVTTWQIAASICYYTVFAATPFFRDAFGLSRFSVGLVVTTLTLGYAVFLIPLGALTDRFGERVTLTLGLFGLAAGAVLVAGASTYALLLAAVFVLGSMYGTAMPGTNKAVFDTVDPNHQNLAMGIKQVGVTGSSGSSALLITGLAGVLFWQAGFLVAAGVGSVVAVGFYLAYSSDSKGSANGYPDFRALLSNRSYVALTAAGFFLGAALFTTTGYTVLYVEESIGASVAFGGVVLALVQVFGSVGRVLTGWLSDVLPGEPRVRIGLVLITQSLGSAAMFVVVAATTAERGAAIAFSALGFFVLGYTGVYYSVMATLVRADEMGGATAGGQLALTSGALVAPPAFGSLADTVGYRTGWLFLAAVVTIAAVLLVYVVRTPPSVATPAAADTSE